MSFDVNNFCPYFCNRLILSLNSACNAVNLKWTRVCKEAWTIVSSVSSVELYWSAYVRLRVLFRNHYHRNTRDMPTYRRGTLYTRNKILLLNIFVGGRFTVVPRTLTLQSYYLHSSCSDKTTDFLIVNTRDRPADSQVYKGLTVFTHDKHLHYKVHAQICLQLPWRSRLCLENNYIYSNNCKFNRSK